MNRFRIKLSSTFHTPVSSTILLRTSWLYHGRNSCCIAYTLHTCFLVGFLVATIIVNVVVRSLPSFNPRMRQPMEVSPFIIFSPRSCGLRQYGFQELQRNDFHPVVIHFIDTSHTDVLDYSQVSQVFWPKVIQKRARLMVGKFFTKDSNSSWYNEWGIVVRYSVSLDAPYGFPAVGGYHWPFS